MKKKFLFFCCLLGLAVNCTFAGETQEVTSRWRIGEIKIDGADSEWAGGLTYLEKEKLAYAISNDSSAIYLCLVFDREIQRQANLFGFTIWLDATGKNKKTFGVRYPLGMFNFDREAVPDPMLMREGPEALHAQMVQMRDEIEVIGPDKDDRNRFAANSSFGIQAACAGAPDTLMCELKIPLQVAPGRPYAIGAGPGQTLSLGFEMGEMNREQRRERMGQRGGGMGGGRPGGGMPPGGGVPGGGRRPGGMGDGPPGGMPREGGMEMPKPFKIWLPLTLAASEAP